MILKFLSAFDLFKVPIVIYFDGKSKRSSILGIVCSFMIFSFLIYQFSTSEFFEKTSPNVVIQSLKQTHAKRIDFNENNPFVLAMADITSVDHKYYDPSIFNVIVTHSINGQTNYLETKRCTYGDLPFTKTFFDSLDLGNTFCLKNKTFFLEGYVDEPDTYSCLSILVYPCDNLTSNGTCKSAETIESFWENKVFTANHYNAQIDAKDFENPFKIYIEPYGVNVDPAFSKTFYAYLKSAEVDTDDGWLFPNSNLQTNIMLDRSSLDFQLRTNLAIPLVKWVMFSSKEKVLCTRKYQKLPESFWAECYNCLQLYAFYSLI